MKRFYFIGLLIVPFYTTLSAQTFSKIQFIEPNVAIRYDSLQFKLRGKFANSIYKKEFAYFDLLNKEKLKITIKVDANAATNNLNTTTQSDSLALAYKAKVIATKSNDIQLTVADTGIVQINGFSCYGFIFTNLKEPEVYNAIHCIHVGNNDFTLIDYHGLNEKDMATSYKNLTIFLKGFKSYSTTEVASMEKLVKDKYSFTISAVTAHKKKNTFTYNGKLTVNQKLTHQLIQVRIKEDADRYSIFKPEKNNSTLLFLKDKRKGALTKEGEVIFLNDVNKSIAVPFTFTYMSK